MSRRKPKRRKSSKRRHPVLHTRDSVQIIGVYREELNIEKMASAIIGLANHFREQKHEEGRTTPSQPGKGYKRS